MAEEYRSLDLRYGHNPHQAPAHLIGDQVPLPIRVLNGAPSAINILDAVMSWQLVSEMKQVFKCPSAASFKHVTPSGAAVAAPLSSSLRRAYFAGERELSPLATAYIRARGCDRLSSFGDCAALSDTVDADVADALRREVSDLVVAPGYEPKALDALRKKKNGKYVILQVTAAHEPPEWETRDIYGMKLVQPRNTYLPELGALGTVVSARKDLPVDAERDLALCQLVLKYTPSNSICLSLGGQTIGVGAGQQSRVDCANIAATKADFWWLRQHPALQEVRFPNGLRRFQRDNFVRSILTWDGTDSGARRMRDIYGDLPVQLTPQDREQWKAQLKEVAFGSDGLIPFRDTIDRANQAGVGYVIEPGGATYSQEVTTAVNEYGMVLVHSGTRLFLH